MVVTEYRVPIPTPKGIAMAFFGSDGFSDPGSLEQNQWQQHEVGHKLDPGRMNERENVAADRDTDQETDQNGCDAPPNVRDTLAVDTEDVAIDHQLHEH